MKIQNTRRNFLKIASLTTLAIPLAGSLGKISANPISLNDFKPDAAVNPPLKLNVKEYGAKGDGVTLDTIALQQAIDRCFVLGRGEVVIPAGNYLTGAIQLRSNVTLRLEKDAILTGTSDFKDYPVMQVRWEGKWIQGHTALIYAVDAENIGIKGPGKIMGSHALGGRPTPEKPFRHPALIEPINCKNITFEDFSTDYERMWSIHPTYCENITVHNLTIRSTGGNGDGIDVDSCKNVLIENCDIATGDDCISLKSGRGMEGYTLLRTTEDVTIRNCKFSDSIFACIGIGSETSGGIRNVTIEHCTFYDTKTYAIYIKTRPGRGAFIENITATDLDVSGMQGGFLRFNLLGSGIQDPVPVPGNEGIPTAKNFSFSNIRVKDIKILVDGTSVHPDKPLDGFTLVNVTGSCEKGISLANITDTQLQKIDVTGHTGPLLSICNVKGTGLDNSQTIEFPNKIPEPIAAPEKRYELR